MSKPYTEEEISNEQQIIDDAKRFAKMFGSFFKLGELLAPAVSIKRACNEANARLTEMRDEEEKLKATMDLKNVEFQKIQAEIAEWINDRESKIAKATQDKQKQLDDIERSLTQRKAELEEMIKKRKDFMDSIGIK